MLIYQSENDVFHLHKKWGNNCAWNLNFLFEAQRKWSLLFSVTRSANFLLYKNKRLTTEVTKTITADIPQLCVNHCLATSGCLAVNFRTDFTRSCELTSGVTSTSRLTDDSSSDVYVVGT